MRNKLFYSIGLLTILACPWGWADFTEDFDDLDGWHAGGNTYGDAGTAIVGDAGVDASYLYRPVALGPGDFVVDFDFLNALNAPSDPGAFPDTLFASIFFVDDIGAFDLPSGSFDEALPLFDLDFQGGFNSLGSISPSPLGGNWQHFTLVFSSSYLYAIPAFELFNLDFEGLPGQVMIDNLQIRANGSTPVVPEPTTLALAAANIIALAGVRGFRSVRTGWSKRAGRV